MGKVQKPFNYCDLSFKILADYIDFLYSLYDSGGHFMNTAEKIRLPDDCTIGYIIESVLGVPLTRSSLFHSHLENLQQVSKSEVHKQVRNFNEKLTQVHASVKYYGITNNMV